MAHKLVKYRLNSDGTIPDFVLHGDHTNGVQGFFYIHDDTVSPPQDGVMLCIPVDNPTGTFDEIQSYEALLEYMSEMASGTTTKYWNDRRDNYVEVSYDPTADSTWVWNRLQAINS